MNTNLIYKHRTCLETGLPALIREWKDTHINEAFRVAPHMAKAIEDILQAVRNLPKEHSEASDEQFAALATTVGAGHALIRLIMECNLEDMCPQCRAVLLLTRETLDSFYSQLELREPPTLQLQGLVQKTLAKISNAEQEKPGTVH